MSHYQSKGDRSEAQLKKAGRSSGPGHQRSGTPSAAVKGGGARGPSPSGSAHPPSAALFNATQASSGAPSSGCPTTPGASTNRGGKRGNGLAGLGRNGQGGGSTDHGSSYRISHYSGGHYQNQQPHTAPSIRQGVGPPDANQHSSSSSGLSDFKQPSSNTSAGSRVNTSGGSPTPASVPFAKQPASIAVPLPPAKPPAAVVPPATRVAFPEPALPGVTGDTSRSAAQPSFSFQFGSITPGFMNIVPGMQVPARTNSAPPNLHEQKREQARFEASCVASAKQVPTVSSLQQRAQDYTLITKDFTSDPAPALTQSPTAGEPQGLVQLPVQYSQGQGLATSVRGHSSQYSQAPVHVSSQVQVSPQQHLQRMQLVTAQQAQAHAQEQVQAQAQGQAQAQAQQSQAQPHGQEQEHQQVLSQQALPQQSLSQQGLSQGMKYPQTIMQPPHGPQIKPQQIGSPLGSQLSAQQVPPQLTHQLGPQMGVTMGGQLPPGMPGASYGPPITNQYIQPQPSRAVKIVNPKTLEELRFDDKAKKGETYLDVGLLTSLSTATAIGSSNGPHQNRQVNYGSGSHHPVVSSNRSYYQQSSGPYAHGGPPFFQSVPSKGVPSRPSGLVNVPVSGYGYAAQTPQGVRYINPPPAVSNSPASKAAPCDGRASHAGADGMSMPPSAFLAGNAMSGPAYTGPNGQPPASASHPPSEGAAHGFVSNERSHAMATTVGGGTFRVPSPASSAAELKFGEIESSSSAGSVLSEETSANHGCPGHILPPGANGESLNAELRVVNEIDPIANSEGPSLKKEHLSRATTASMSVIPNVTVSVITSKPAIVSAAPSESGPRVATVPASLAPVIAEKPKTESPKPTGISRENSRKVNKKENKQHKQQQHHIPLSPLSTPVVHAEGGDALTPSPSGQENSKVASPLSITSSGVATVQLASMKSGLQRSQSGVHSTRAVSYAPVKASNSIGRSDEYKGPSRILELEKRAGGTASGSSLQNSEAHASLTTASVSEAEESPRKASKQGLGKVLSSPKSFEGKDDVKSGSSLSATGGMSTKQNALFFKAILSAPVEKGPSAIEDQCGELSSKKNEVSKASPMVEALNVSRTIGGGPSEQKCGFNQGEGEVKSTDVDDSNRPVANLILSESVVVPKPSAVDNLAILDTEPFCFEASPADAVKDMECRKLKEPGYASARDMEPTLSSPEDMSVTREDPTRASVETRVDAVQSTARDMTLSNVGTTLDPPQITSNHFVENEISGAGPNEQSLQVGGFGGETKASPDGSGLLLPFSTSAGERELETQSKSFSSAMYDNIRLSIAGSTVGSPEPIDVHEARALHWSGSDVEGKHSETPLDSNPGANEHVADSAEGPLESAFDPFLPPVLQYENPSTGSDGKVTSGPSSDDGVPLSAISRSTSDAQSENAGYIEEENTRKSLEHSVGAVSRNDECDSPSSVVPEVKLAPSKRKKRKDLLVKADAQGPTADLFTAYKAPEEKKIDVVRRPETPGSLASGTGNKKAAMSASGKPVVKELDDWEDAAEFPTPKIYAAPAVAASILSSAPREVPSQHGFGIKKYTKDYLLSQRDLNRELPPHFEIRADVAENLLSAPLIASSYIDALPSPVRGLDRPASGGSRGDRRTNTVGAEDRWTRQPGAAASPGRGPSDARMDMGMPGPAGGFRPGQGSSAGLMRVPPVARAGMGALGMMPMTGLLPGGILPAHHPMMSPAPGRSVVGVDADRWQRAPAGQRGLIPSPRAPLPAMHKTENRYQIGNISDEEQVKQRLIKGILNKLTPQNFEKLFAQVKEVNIDSATTLTGVISQIFDKALTEPTFCEMYAQFCAQLAGELPEFVEEEEKITFKRVLLNKCQEEFEREQREQEEAEKVEADGEVKLSAEEREEKRIAARRRMLGNIRFIGELYKKNMLTERIMHECIKKLLGEFQNPYEEDVEALCKLMTTIGKIIDHAKAKEHIDAYFKRMEILSENFKLSSRLRFMLKDCIDLRKNGWMERRKVEGPKKIEDVHRDAVQERQQAASGRDRPRSSGMGPGIGRRPGNEFPMRGPPSPLYPPGGPMGGGMPMAGFRGTQPPSGVLRGGYGQDVRMEDRLMMETRPMPMPLSQRSSDEGSLTLGPQGNLGRGMGVRTSLGPGRSALADVPPMIHGDARRPGMGMGMQGYGGTILDRGAYPGREELSKRGPGAERALGAADRPVLERPERLGPSMSGRDMRGPDRPLVERSGLSAYPTSSLRPITPPNPVSALSSPVVPLPLTEEELRKKCISTITEFFSVRDMKEAGQCVDDLNSPKFHPVMVSVWVSEALDKKDTDRDQLAKLLVYLSRAKEPPSLTDDQIKRGFELVLASLEDTTVDVPRAPDYVGGMLSKLILAGVFTLAHVGKLLKDGGPDPGSLLVIGDALNMLGVILDTIRRQTGEAAMLDYYKESKLNVEDFIASEDKERSGKLETFLDKKNLQSLYPMIPLEKYFREAMVKDEPMTEILKWVKENVPQSTISEPAFSRMVMTQVLRHSVPLDANGRVIGPHLEAILEGNIKRFTSLLKTCLPEKERALEASQRHYIVAVQLFANEVGHPPGLMSILFQRLYVEDVISEHVFQKWKDDVEDSTPGRDKAIKETFNWFRWLDEAPEEDED